MSRTGITRFVRVHPFATRYVEALEAGLLAAFPGTTWHEARSVPAGDDALLFVHHLLLRHVPKERLRRTIAEFPERDETLVEVLASGVAGAIVEEDEGASLVVALPGSSTLEQFLLPGHDVPALAGKAKPAIDFFRDLDARWSEPVGGHGA